MLLAQQVDFVGLLELAPAHKREQERLARIRHLFLGELFLWEKALKRQKTKVRDKKNIAL